MGVKFNRDYKLIVADLANAILQIDDCYDVFDMPQVDWLDLDENDQVEYAKTLADDIFYGLGSEPSVPVGSGHVDYDPGKHIIKVTVGNQLNSVIHIIHLI
jgi:hypothetical protein